MRFSASTPWHSKLPSSPLTKGLALERGDCSLPSNRPATPLNDAQLGGYFFAQMPRAGSTVT